MSWLESHQQSEILASEAEAHIRRREYLAGEQLYQQAADFEAAAFDQLDELKPRTLGIIGVSAAALLLKARNFTETERFALRALNRSGLPKFARFELRQILQDAWVEEDKLGADVTFLPGRVLVAVRGGLVMYGGAPLDMIVNKIKSIQAIFFRTIEHTRGDPLRRQAQPAQEVIEACRPWLIQAPAGSYQFSVAVQKPTQPDFFRKEVDPQVIVDKFLTVLRSSAADDMDSLAAIVPEDDYRAAFVRLTRDLAPTGKLFDQMEVRGVGDAQGVQIGVATRTQLTKRINREKKGDGDAERPETLRGVLRAVHLDKDWVELGGEKEPIRIYGVQDTLDDVIGPMVNRAVVVRARRPKKQYQLVDIELEE
jgi:hypothetical protein